MFFSLNAWVLALILGAVIFGATFLGLWIGRSLRDRGDTLRLSPLPLPDEGRAFGGESSRA